MIQSVTRRTAILVDGGYYRKQAAQFWGKERIEVSAKDRANELIQYCKFHLEMPSEPRELYRIFYYDCEAMEREMIHPLTGEKINFSEGEGTKWAKTFFGELSKKRKVALRLGELAESQAYYALKPRALSAILQRTKTIDDLKKSDFKLVVKQKGVDTRIGLDAASLAYGGYVDQIILIAGDSDFVPVAKMARRNGIDFILDPMKKFIRPALEEHIDGIESFVDEMTQEKTAPPSEPSDLEGDAMREDTADKQLTTV